MDILDPANLSHKKVVVYADAGVGPLCLAQTQSMLLEFLGHTHLVQTLDAPSLIQGEWFSNCDLLVMPGGADLPYVQKLSGPGNRLLQDFVRSGGAYLGLCAGAYYGTCFVLFDQGGPREVLGKRDLAFFPGKATGPLPGVEGPQVLPMKIKGMSLPLPLFYQDGCFFESELPSDWVPFAWYPSGQVAMGQLPFGLGTVSLSGVHFEYDPAWLSRELSEKERQEQGLSSALLDALWQGNERRKTWLSLFFSQWAPRR